MGSDANDILAFVFNKNRYTYTINTSVSGNTENILTLVLFDTLTVQTNISFQAELFAFLRFDAFSFFTISAFRA